MSIILPFARRAFGARLDHDGRAVKAELAADPMAVVDMTVFSCVKMCHRRHAARGHGKVK